MTLDEAIAVEDAIEAIGEGCTREEYVAMHNFTMRGHAAFTYDAAGIEIETRGTARKALNFVRSVINTYR